MTALANPNPDLIDAHSKAAWVALIATRAMQRLLTAGWRRCEILAACNALQGLLFSDVDFDPTRYANRLIDRQDCAMQLLIEPQRWNVLVAQVDARPELADALESVMFAPLLDASFSITTNSGGTT